MPTSNAIIVVGKRVRCVRCWVAYGGQTLETKEPATGGIQFVQNGASKQL